MKIKITIDCGNAAFDPEPSYEVARILSKIARLIREDECPLTVWDNESLNDINGNTVGRIEVTK